LIVWLLGQGNILHEDDFPIKDSNAECTAITTSTSPDAREGAIEEPGERMFTGMG
jgi:hypothetical protein